MQDAEPSGKGYPHHSPGTPPHVLVVGCGPKALALAAKCHILRELGKGDVRLTIVEKSEIGANWSGAHGFTDGRQTLGTPPEKDIGFPYTSEFGVEVDAGMLRFSWQAYQVQRKRYGEWVDRGKKHPPHNEWARYLCWVQSQLGIAPHIGEVTKVTHCDGHFSVRCANQDGKTKSIRCNGVVFTGPGEPIKVAGSDHDWSHKICNGRSFWQMKAVFGEPRDGSVAVIGGGETAASIVLALAENFDHLRIDLINRHGTIFTRGESYHENLLYTDAGEWGNTSPLDRQEFIRRTDRGVFSVEAKRRIDGAHNIQFVSGTVNDLVYVDRFVEVRMTRFGKPVQKKYDRVIVAIGFNPIEPLRLLAKSLRPALTDSEVMAGIDQFLRIPVSKDAALKYYYADVHMPMLAGLAQGPGFPNLSCLGTLADRIIKRYFQNP